MSWLDTFVSNTQQEVVEELQHLVDEKGIKEKVLEDAQELAKIAARHILDETQPELQAFPSVPIDGDKELQYLLVLEFLQSAGFKFAREPAPGARAQQEGAREAAEPVHVR